MANKTAVYHKSAKGTEALATRQHGLSPKLRSFLIMIDGKRSVEDLAGLSGPLGDASELLGQLLEQGLIEPVAPETLAAQTAPPAPTRPQITLPEAQRFAVRRLTDILGPTAEELCLRIESARNANEFNAAVRRAEGILREFSGAEVATGFAAEVASHKPTA